MKKLFLIFAVLAVALPLAVLVTGFLIPRDYRVDREIEIKALPTEIFPLVNNPSNRVKWSPFQGPEVKTKFEGPAAGGGAIMHWDGPKSGGKIVITRSEEPNLVEYNTHFDDGYPTSTSRFRFESADGGSSTKVVWEFFGQVPAHPLRRYFVFFIDGSVGDKHFRGLENMKRYLESGSKSVASS
ncbi:MAG: SRPBCC family protein [Verrucomicrobiota bacterium]